MQIQISSEPFNPWQQLEAYQQQQTGLEGQYGASAVFVGSMRDFNENDQVRSMQLEHYPAMTEKFLQTLAKQAIRDWSLLDVLIVHRVGEIKPADTIVLLAVWSAHRAEAFTACRELMEALKSRAPFWKQETLDTGRQRWVEKNTPG